MQIRKNQGKIYPIRYAIVILSLALGVINLPAFIFVTIRPINVFWNFIYSIGWFLMEIIFGTQPLIMGRWQELFGMVVWPMIVCFLLYRLIKRIDEIKTENRARSRAALYALLALSCILNIPNQLIGKGKFSFIPTYIAYFSTFT